MSEALHADTQEDMHFMHAVETSVANVPSGQHRGINIFGPGISPTMTASPTGINKMREITSVLLNDAGFETNSMTVYDRDSRLFLDGVLNLPNPKALANFDPEFCIDETGELYQADDWWARATYYNCIAMPVCGPGFHNYGHFLYDGLPGIYMHAQMFGMRNSRIVGPSLRPWQRAILAALGLEEYYLEIRGHAVFRKLLTTTLLSMHVSYPTNLIRGMFDRIRCQYGVAPGKVNRRIYLSRGDDTTRRVLRNRSEIEAQIIALGFEIIQSEKLSFEDQVHLMASSHVVIGESGAAMANLGFCKPGTIVLEIQPDRFIEGWTRGMCFLLAHRWHVFFTTVDSPPSNDGSFSYMIDSSLLVSSIKAILANTKAY